MLPVLGLLREQSGCNSFNSLIVSFITQVCLRTIVDLQAANEVNLGFFPKIRVPDFTDIRFIVGC